MKGSPLSPQPPAPFTPAPAAAPPFDPAYESGTAAAQAQYGNTLAGIQYQEGRARQQYGFDDPSNPFNLAAMLQRNYQQGQRGTSTSMAARGQLYSGALQRNLDEGTFGYNRSYDALRRQYDDLMQGYQFQRTQADVDREAAVAGYQADRTGRWQEALPPDPGPPSQGLQVLPRGPYRPRRRGRRV
jgi:hypothetical protein